MISHFSLSVTAHGLSAVLSLNCSHLTTGGPRNAKRSQQSTTDAVDVDAGEGAVTGNKRPKHQKTQAKDEQLNMHAEVVKEAGVRTTVLAKLNDPAMKIFNDELHSPTLPWKPMSTESRKLASDPVQLIKFMLSELGPLFAQLSSCGGPLPFEHGSESAWTAPWNDLCADQALKGRSSRYMSAVTLGWIDLFKLQYECPPWSRVIRCFQHWFSNGAQDILVPFHAILERPLDLMGDQKSDKIVLSGGLEILWGSIVGAFVEFRGLDLEKQSTKDKMLPWIRAWRSIVVTVHHCPDPIAAAKLIWQHGEDLQSHASVCEASVITQSIRLKELMMALVHGDGEATLIACCKSLSSVNMVDKTTQWDSTRVLGALQSVHTKIVSIPKAMAAARLYQSELGECDKLWSSVWYVNALLTMINNDNDIPQIIHWLLVEQRRGLTAADRWSVQGMRGRALGDRIELGLVNKLQLRQRLADLLMNSFDKYLVTDKPSLRSIYRDPLEWDATFPCERVMALALRANMPLSPDQSFVQRLSTNVEKVLHERLNQLFDGSLDDMLKEDHKKSNGNIPWDDLKGWVKATDDGLQLWTELESASALDEKKMHGGDPDGGQNGERPAAANAAAAAAALVNTHDDDDDDIEMQKMLLRTKAMQSREVRSKHHILSPSEPVNASEAYIQKIPRQDGLKFGKWHRLLVVDVDEIVPERESRPWGKSGQAASCKALERKINAMAACSHQDDIILVVCGSLTDNRDACRKWLDSQTDNLFLENTHTESDEQKKGKTEHKFIVKELLIDFGEKGCMSSKKSRGALLSQGVCYILIACHHSRSLRCIKKKDLLYSANGVTTHSRSWRVEQFHPAKAPSISIAEKAEILKWNNKTICTSTVGPTTESNKLSKRGTAPKCVQDVFPLIWSTKGHKMYDELWNMLSPKQVVDMGAGDGSKWYACAAMKNIPESWYVVNNELHLKWLSKYMDETVLKFMANKEMKNWFVVRDENSIREHFSEFFVDAVDDERDEGSEENETSDSEADE